MFSVHPSFATVLCYSFVEGSITYSLSKCRLMNDGDNMRSDVSVQHNNAACQLLRQMNQNEPS